MSRTVEAIFPLLSPPSRIKSTPWPKQLKTSSAFRQAGLPEIFALVPVIGTPRPFVNAIAMGWLESRIPIFPVPAVSRGETSGPASKISVRGPGQNSSMSLWATGGIRFTYRLNASEEGINIKTGLPGCLFFTEKSRLMAFSFVESTARP